MPCELCSLPTLDGLLLDGAFTGPAKPPANGSSRAWVVIHGTGSNFTAPGVLATLSAMLLQRGEAVLRLNTRGHDLMARIPSIQGTVSGGAAWERLEHASLDIAAACSWLAERDYQKVSLLGHSLGGVKALLSQVSRLVIDVDEIVALSPPRLNHAKLSVSDEFRSDFDRAVALVGMGQSGTLIEMREPQRAWMSASAIVDKYGPEDRYDYVPQLATMHRPMLIVLDAKSPETSPAFEGLPEALEEVARGIASLEVRRQSGSDIHYSGSESAIMQAILDWRARRNRDTDISI
ncbi:MAG: alpha/beta fold hydrolase [Planctomyces sp.]|nr:alpha/beta fold hydrolase [Planctomyces sp.]